MKLFLRRNAPLFYALAAMLALYIPWLNRGYNNYEFPFVFAGRALANSADADLINAYWPDIANPLGYSFFLSLIYRTIGFSDTFWISRLPALFGAVLVIISGWIIANSIWSRKKYFFYIWVTLLLFQPMFIVFSTSGTTDLLPVGLLMLAVSFALGFQDKRFMLKIVIGILFGIAIVIKYNTAYFGLALVAASLHDSQLSKIAVRQKIRDFLPYVVVPGLILGSYLYWSYEHYGVFISSRLEISRPDYFNFSNLFKNFVKYLSFFGLFLATLPISALLQRSNGARLKLFRFPYLIIICTFLVGWYYSGFPAGELDFGRFFDPIHPSFRRVIEALGAVLGLCAFLVMFKHIKSGSKVKTVLLFGLIPYLVFISASYPSQRYLTFVVPGSLLLLVDAMQIFTRRTQTILVSFSVAVFASVSLFGLSYLTSQGNASEEMAVWVEENNLISQTSAGVIKPHAGQHWWGVAPDETRYEIIAVNPSAEAQVKERILHREPMKVLGKVTRVYLLREIPVSP